MSAALVEAVDITVKYDTKFSTGQTRRQRAAGFGRSSPEVVVHDYMKPLWMHFWDIRHTKEGNSSPITYLDLQAWRSMTGNLILSRECDMILKMDSAFRSAAHEVSKQDAELNKRYDKGRK